MTMNRQWLLKARPHGMIGPDNFEYTETQFRKSATAKFWCKTSICPLTRRSATGWSTARVICPPWALGK